eukprot:5981495-Pleurochrysis_carterae.AAC.2
MTCIPEDLPACPMRALAGDAKRLRKMFVRKSSRCAKMQQTHAPVLFWRERARLGACLRASSHARGVRACSWPAW